MAEVAEEVDMGVATVAAVEVVAMEAGEVAAATEVAAAVTEAAAVAMEAVVAATAEIAKTTKVTSRKNNQHYLIAEFCNSRVFRCEFEFCFVSSLIC